MMSLWTVGASVIILLAALQNVPEELYESARLDGAGFWRQSFSITMPMISPALFFIIVVNTIAGLQTFDEAYTAFFGFGQHDVQQRCRPVLCDLSVPAGVRVPAHGVRVGDGVAAVRHQIVTAVQLIVSRRLVYYEGETAMTRVLPPRPDRPSRTTPSRSRRRRHRRRRRASAPRGGEPDGADAAAQARPRCGAVVVIARSHCWPSCSPTRSSGWSAPRSSRAARCSTTQLIPKTFTLDNYVQVWAEAPVGLWLLNTSS